MFILIWLVIAILAAIGEMLTLDLFLASVSVAAIFTGLLAVLLPGAVQIVVFTALSVGGIAFVRPAIKHVLGVHDPLEIGGAARRSSVAGRSSRSRSSRRTTSGFRSPRSSTTRSSTPAARPMRWPTWWLRWSSSPSPPSATSSAA